MTHQPNCDEVLELATAAAAATTTGSSGGDDVKSFAVNVTSSTTAKTTSTSEEKPSPSTESRKKRTTKATALAAVLFLADNLLCGLVIGPLTVFYWRGTWTLLGRYVTPSRADVNGWICVVVGVSGLMAVVYVQSFLTRRLRVDNLLHWIFGFHAFTYVVALFNVCHWRGVWTVLDHYTGGVNEISAWTSFALGKMMKKLLSRLSYA